MENLSAVVTRYFSLFYRYVKIISIRFYFMRGYSDFPKLPGTIPHGLFLKIIGTDKPGEVFNKKDNPI